MMIDFYYSIGIVVLLTLIKRILVVKKSTSIFNWLNSNDTKINNKMSSSDFRSYDEYNTFISNNIFFIYEFIWLLFGLITNNYFVFIYIIVLELLFKISISGIRGTKIGENIYILFLSSKIAFYSFLILNNFVLNINLKEVLIDSIKML